MPERHREPQCVEDLTVRFLALSRKGPVRSRAALLRRDATEALLRVELCDAGQGGRVVTVATARVRAG